MAPKGSTPNSLVSSARGYQLEMLQESLKRNIVVALDTGSGKTLIAILRIKSHLEQDSKKAAWFLAPTVVLCEQQKDVIASSLPVSVGLISGSLEPNQWRDHELWRGVIEKNRVIVSTPQVLLDAMRNGHISLGQDIGLIVFDEAHHVADKHPYNMIMQEQYFRLPPRAPAAGSMRDDGQAAVRPAILGLTASPSFGADVVLAFATIEANLDSVILAPQLHRQELAEFVHRPRFSHAKYTPNPYGYATDPRPSNLMSLRAVNATLNIEDDPYVISLRNRLKDLPPSPERTKIDQRLSRTLNKQDSYTHKGLRDLLNTAEDICVDLGPWAADWYIAKVVERARAGASPYRTILNNWQDREKTYLHTILHQIQITPVSYDPENIHSYVTDKVHALIECLEREKATVESMNEEYSCLIFVTRRDAVLALSEILNHHPRTKDLFRVGCLLGSSDSSYRRAFLDIARQLLIQTQSETLNDFRLGEKNVIVSTAVAEEGIDIQACGTVIRWDAPNNMVSWAQSRGRARRKQSSFVLMFQIGGIDQALVDKWMALEQEMTRLYYEDRSRRTQQLIADGPAGSDEHDMEFSIDETGALLTLDSAVSRLEHFCAVIPNGVHVPYYDIDPPDLPEGWHENPTYNAVQYQGPFGATVTLPRILPPELRVFKVDREHSNKRSALRHVAFKAYLALYRAGLLNNRLLPLTSVVDPDLEGEVKEMLKDVQKRASVENVALQMSSWEPDGVSFSDELALTKITLENLPPLSITTRVDPRIPPGNETFVLYPGDSPPLTVTLEPMGRLPLSDPRIVGQASLYTRRLFAILHDTRLDWSRLDFEYLFLPNEAQEDSYWDERRQWWASLEEKRGRGRPEDTLFASSSDFAPMYSWPQDIALVRDPRRTGHPSRFIGWQFDALPEEEEAELRERLKLDENMAIRYPLVMAEPLPRRVNLLIPREGVIQASREDQTLLLLDRSQVVLASHTDLRYAMYLPSVLRYLAKSITLHSFTNNVLAGTPMAAIPTETLMTALTAPASQEPVNYQRLETLGDTTLKFLTSMQLLADYHLWHEGYLSRKKDHTVSNAQLAKQAMRLELYRWIIRDRFVPRKWKPAYRRRDDQVETPDEGAQQSNQQSGKKAKAKQSEQMSTKLLADVVESLIGAARIAGDLPLATEMIRLFGCGVEWQPLHSNVSRILSRVPSLPDFPTSITEAESILGYTFKHKALLVEALTHSSHQSDLPTTSYERMEFAGDAVLDLIVTDYLYHAPGKNYSPGYLHLYKSAVVNQHFLAFICLRASRTTTIEMPGPDKSQPEGRIKIVLTSEEKRVHLFQCILHSNHRVLEDQHNSFGRFGRVCDEIERRLSKGRIFPWAPLTRLQAAKFLSDVIESLIGAVYFDASGNLDVVRNVLRTLGILDVLERCVHDNVDVLHPVSRLSVWAGQHQMKVVYRYGKEAGKLKCTVILRPIRRDEKGRDIAKVQMAGLTPAEVKKAEEEEEDPDDLAVVEVSGRYRGRASQNEIRFAAAERAIDTLEVESTEGLMQKEELLSFDLDADSDSDDDEVSKGTASQVNGIVATD